MLALILESSLLLFILLQDFAFKAYGQSFTGYVCEKQLTDWQTHSGHGEWLTGSRLIHLPTDQQPITQPL
eukprot:scaffold43247_cov15-Prasinocladus_malaysianus.AAC.1